MRAFEAFGGSGRGLDVTYLTRNPAGLAKWQAAPKRARTSTSAPSASSTRIAPRVAGPLIQQGQTEEQLTEFSGMDLVRQVNDFGLGTQGWEPPNPQIAVGGGYVMEMVNRTGSIWTKSGRFLMDFDLDPFFFDPSFNVPSSFRIVSPQLLFDAQSQRWFATVEGQGRATPTSAFIGNVYMAVSVTADPTGNWYRGFLIPKFSGAPVFQDSPKLGISDDKAIVSWDDFTQPPCQGQTTFSCFVSQENYVLAKSQVMAGNFNGYCTITLTTCTGDNQGDGVDSRGIPIGSVAVAPARSLSTTPTAYLLYNDTDPYFLTEDQCVDPAPTPKLGSCPTLGIIVVSGVPGSTPGSPGPGGPVTITLRHPAFPTTPTNYASIAPPSPLQPGTAPSLRIGDDRLESAVYEANTLWAAWTDGNCPSSTPWTNQAMAPTNACARYIKVDTVMMGITGYLQQGDASQDAYSPGVSMDSAGGMFTTYTVSNEFGVYPGPIVSGLPVGNPGGLSFVIGAQSPGPYDSGPCGGHDFWSTYTGLTQDPTDPTDVWAVGEWVPSASNTCDWGTAIVRLTWSAPTVKSLTPSSGPPYGNQVGIKGTDFALYQGLTTVKFGGQSVPFTIVSPDEIMTAAPPSASSSFPNTVSVTVTTPDGTSDGTAPAAQYTYRVRSESTVLGPPAAAGQSRNPAPPPVPQSPAGRRPLTLADLPAVSAGISRVFGLLRQL